MGLGEASLGGDRLGLREGFVIIGVRLVGQFFLRAHLLLRMIKYILITSVKDLLSIKLHPLLVHLAGGISTENEGMKGTKEWKRRDMEGMKRYGKSGKDGKK